MRSTTELRDSGRCGSAGAPEAVLDVVAPGVALPTVVTADGIPALVPLSQGFGGDGVAMPFDKGVVRSSISEALAGCCRLLKGSSSRLSASSSACALVAPPAACNNSDGSEYRCFESKMDMMKHAG